MASDNRENTRNIRAPIGAAVLTATLAHLWLMSSAAESPSGNGVFATLPPKPPEMITTRTLRHDHAPAVATRARADHEDCRRRWSTQATTGQRASDYQGAMLACLTAMDHTIL